MKNIGLFLKLHREIFFLVLIWLLFIFVYSYRILQFPIFEDEAELLFLSQKVLSDPLRNLFILMRYGPLPALSWLVASVNLFVRDSLLSGRLTNVFLTSTLVFWLYFIRKLYNWPGRFFALSSLLIIFSPILLLNARVALWDTSVLVGSAWYIYFFLKATKNSNKLTLFIFFFILLFSLLIKFTSVFALVALAPFLIKGKNYKILTIVLAALFIFVLVVFSFRTSVLGDAGTSLVFNSREIFTKIHTNIWLYINWFRVYFPLLLLYIFFFIYAAYSYRKNKSPEVILIMIIWFAVSSLAMIFFNRFFYPRHMLILVLPLTVIIGYCLVQFPLVLSSVIVALVIALRLSLFSDILLNYQNAAIAKEDRFQYFEDYTSGINVGNISKYLAGLSEKKKIVVWLDGTWVMEYGLRRELSQDPNILFRSFGPLQKIVKDPAGDNYVIVNKREPPNIKSFKLIKEFSWNGHKVQSLYYIP